MSSGPQRPHRHRNHELAFIIHRCILIRCHFIDFFPSPTFSPIGPHLFYYLEYSDIYVSLVKTDLCELAADSTFGIEARFGQVLLVLVCTQAARAAELLERLAGVDLCHDGTLHVCDVPEKHKRITGHR